jgi:hypothetical protein
MLPIEINGSELRRRSQLQCFRTRKKGYNRNSNSSAQKKRPRAWRGTFPLKRQTPELAIGLLLLLTRLLLAAALLLLTGLLVGVLVLLARIWGLVAHSGSPLLNAVRGNPASGDWFRGNSSSAPRRRICVDGLA